MTQTPASFVDSLDALDSPSTRTPTLPFNFVIHWYLAAAGATWCALNLGAAALGTTLALCYLSVTFVSAWVAFLAINGGMYLMLTRGFRRSP
jgi:hypothetical protein